MLSAKVKWVIYLPVNAACGWVLFTVIYTVLFASAPWDWAKAGWTILLYFGCGLVVSLALSCIMWFWKHWTWTNVLIYRPATAAFSTIVLWVGFTQLIGANPTLTQAWVMTAIAKLCVVGLGLALGWLIRESFGQKVTKEFIGAT